MFLLIHYFCFSKDLKAQTFANLWQIQWFFFFILQSSHCIVDISNWTDRKLSLIMEVVSANQIGAYQINKVLSCMEYFSGLWTWHLR